MKSNLITEDTIKQVLSQVLSEQLTKVKRDDFNRVQFKIDELQNSLNETMKEFRKLEDSIPEGLKTMTNGRVNGISSNLDNAKKLLTQLKDKVKQHKKSTHSQSIEEKKK